MVQEREKEKCTQIYKKKERKTAVHRIHHPLSLLISLISHEGHIYIQFPTSNSL